jgi:hypothetical protein
MWDEVIFLNFQNYYLVDFIYIVIEDTFSRVF